MGRLFFPYPSRRFIILKYKVMDILKMMYIGVVVILLSACGGSEQESARQAPIQPVSNPAPVAPAPNTATTTPATPPPPAEPAQNADGVWHYTCPNGHAGGGGSATACSECGATLAHNQAYHPPNPAAAAANPAAAAAAGGAVAPVTGGTPPTMFADPSKTPVNTTVGTTPTAAPVQPVEPAQNAAGVWHYTCPSGCSGGGGSATACSKCGATLAHNQAYH